MIIPILLIIFSPMSFSVWTTKSTFGAFWCDGDFDCGEYNRRWHRHVLFKVFIVLFDRFCIDVFFLSTVLHNIGSGFHTLKMTNFITQLFNPSKRFMLFLKTFHFSRKAMQFTVFLSPHTIPLLEWIFIGNNDYIFLFILHIYTYASFPDGTNKWPSCIICRRFFMVGLANPNYRYLFRLNQEKFHRIDIITKCVKWCIASYHTKWRCIAPCIFCIWHTAD